LAIQVIMPVDQKQAAALGTLLRVRAAHIAIIFMTTVKAATNAAQWTAYSQPNNPRTPVHRMTNNAENQR
jgi:hypothetical protein